MGWFMSNKTRGLEWANACALLGLVIIGVVLFRVHLGGAGTFVGDSDRLNTFLNLRKFEVENIRYHRSLNWNEFMFMGFSTTGLHYMLLGSDPTAYIEALLPSHDLFRITGYVSCTLLVLAGWAAYFFIRDTCHHPFFALVGAALYVLSAFSLVRISQVDAAFAVLILIPLGLLVLRRTTVKNAAVPFVLLTITIASLLFFTFLQEAAYALALFGAYAAYRGLKLRSWRPPLIFAACLSIAVVISLPRILTVFRDVSLLDRTTTFQTTCWCEIFRWFNDGVFGRFPQEVLAIGNGFNLHEGLQLYTSTFAALAIIAGAMRLRGPLGVAAVVTFLAVLSLIFSPWVGSRGFAYLALGGIGLYVMVARFGRCVVRFKPFTIELNIARNSLWEHSPTSALHGADAPFDLFFLAFALAVILIEPVRYLVYLAFMRMDLTHSRVSGTALLPMCAFLSAVLRDMFGGSSERDQRRAELMVLGSSALLALAVLWLNEVLATSPLTARLIEVLKPGRWIPVLPVELAKIVWGIVFFVLLLIGIWIFRRSESLRHLLVFSLGFIMVFQAFKYADFQLSGHQTWTFPVAFLDNNFFNAPAEALLPPSTKAMEAFHQRLEVNQFRSVLVADPRIFPAFSAPHISQFWRLRLAEGYGAGVPVRLARLPWPEGVRTLRALSFSDTAHLPWALLAVLNVKYAIILDPALYFNLEPEAGPRNIRVLQNPLPVVPREFFARTVRPAPHFFAPSSQASVPLPPTGINTTITSANRLVLSWVNASHDSSYRIERKEGLDGSYAEIGVTGPNAVSNDNFGLKPGTEYYFRIRGCTDQGCSAYSPEVHVVTATEGVRAPEGLRANVVSSSDVLLSWSNSSPNIRYRVERKEGANGFYLEVGVTSWGARSYRISGLAPLATHYFRLRACTFGGCSPHSAQVSAATPSALSPSELRGVVPSNPVAESIAERFPAPVQFSAQGVIRASYNGGKIDIHVDSSDQPRFLVLNELYHPDWKAFAGKTELTIYPTNVVMRGLIVPPRTTEIRLRFVPFLDTPAAAVILGAGLALLWTGWRLFARLEERG